MVTVALAPVVSTVAAVLDALAPTSTPMLLLELLMAEPPPPVPVMDTEPEPTTLAESPICTP
jgi:hypothetical protein